MHNSIDGKTFYMFVVQNLIMFMSKKMLTRAERTRHSALKVVHP